MYVLTEQEFNHLNEAIYKQTAFDKQTLQKVCTLAAKHVPVPSPWGLYPNQWLIGDVFWTRILTLATAATVRYRMCVRMITRGGASNPQ